MNAKTSKPDRKRGDRGRRREPSEYEETTLSIDRVTRVVKGGRRMRFRAVVIVGNRKGKVGLGTGKAAEVQAAVQKAVRDAKRQMLIVPMQGDTIPHEVNIKHKAARIRVMPASKGTGIIAGGPLRIILDHAGVKDALAKYFGSDNKLVCAQAAIKALAHLRGSRAATTADNAASQAAFHTKTNTPTSIGLAPTPPEPNLPIKEKKITEKDKKEMDRGIRG